MNLPPLNGDNLLCCECTCPLSVGPVRVRADGGSVCGRCNPDSSVLPRNLAYEAVAYVYLFPCIFSTAGCPMSVRFNDKSHHEAMCPFRLHQCPVLSDCPWKGTVEQLPDHYLAVHPELCTENSSLEIPITTDYYRPYLLYHTGLYFLLQIKCLTNQEKLWFNFVYLGAPEMAKFLEYKLKFSKNQTSPHITLDTRTAVPLMYMQMDLNKSVSVDLCGIIAILKECTEITCSWNINIRKEYKLNQALLDELLCFQCENYMTPPIYICKEGHCVCADCKGFEMDCICCEEAGKHQNLLRAPFLENLSKQFKFECKWEGCFNKSNNIRQHEQGCSQRIYDCPIEACTKWSGSLEDLSEHFEISHPSYNVHLPALKNSSVYWSRSYDYIIAFKEIFAVHFQKSQDKERLLQIYFKGRPSLAPMFQYEVEVVQSNKVIKVYQLSRFLKNRYEVLIPVTEDTSHCKYKIKIIKRSELALNMQCTKF